MFAKKIIQLQLEQQLDRLWQQAEDIRPMRLFETGRTNFRTGIVEGSGNISHFEKTELRPDSPKALVDLVAGTIARSLPAYQDTVLYTLAGPVTGGRVVKQLPNIWGPRCTDVPLAEMIEKEVLQRTGRKITVALAN
ncbi:MAG: hypothetical protein WC838_07940, partial [Candidatus Margulisiibacteriota bacterium]